MSNWNYKLKIKVMLMLYIRSYWGSSEVCFSDADDLYLTPEQVTQYKDVIKNILAQKGSSNIESPIYTGKLCDIPRYKIKEYLEEKKLKRTNCFDYASTIFINKSYLEDFLLKLNGSLNRAVVYTLKKDDKGVYSQIIGQIRNKITQGLAVSHYNQQKEFIKVGVHYNDVKTIKTNFNVLNQAHSKEEMYIVSLYRNSKWAKLMEILDFYTQTPDIKIVFDDDFINSLNTEGIELEGEYLETIKQMLESQDADNIKMALDMLSNVNIEKNSTTLVLLLNKYKHLFSWGRGISPSTHQGYKLLKNYFNNKGINWHQNWKGLTNVLAKNLPQDIEIIKQFALENINSDLQCYQKVLFEVTDIKFKDL